MNTSYDLAERIHLLTMSMTDTEAQSPAYEKQAKRLGLSHMWVGFAAFAAAIPMGLYQVAERSNLFPAAESREIYYASVTTHGVLMAYVLTTFFIMGFGYYVALHSLKQNVWSPLFSWAGFTIALAGTLIAAVPLLLGQASVMYTFYPPEMAVTSFYIGAAMLFVGSWFWCVDMIVAMMQWRRANPGMAVPLVCSARPSMRCCGSGPRWGQHWKS